MEYLDIVFKSTLLRNQILKSDEVGTFRFDGKNLSTKELKVIKAFTSCGCSTITYSKSVQPGETFYITLNIDKRGQSGSFNQSATLVYSNNQEVKLKVNGTIGD